MIAAGTKLGAYTVVETHRDLKPDNVMVTSEGRTKILDFGVATRNEVHDADAPTIARTEAGMVVGTVGFRVTPSFGIID